MCSADNTQGVKNRAVFYRAGVVCNDVTDNPAGGNPNFCDKLIWICLVRDRLLAGCRSKPRANVVGFRHQFIFLRCFLLKGIHLVAPHLTRLAWLRTMRSHVRIMPGRPIETIIESALRDEGRFLFGVGFLIWWPPVGPFCRNFEKFKLHINFEDN